MPHQILRFWGVQGHFSFRKGQVRPMTEGTNCNYQDTVRECLDHSALCWTPCWCGLIDNMLAQRPLNAPPLGLVVTVPPTTPAPL